MGSKKNKEIMLIKIRYLLISFLLLLVSCSSSKKIPFEGELIGLTIKTTLDSEDAVKFATSKDLLYEGGHSGLDIKTIGIIKKIYNQNIDINKKYRNGFFTEKDLIKKISHKYTVLFVPGFLYESDITTGADFKKQRDLFHKLEIKNKLIEIKENGLVAENAKFISDYIKNNNQDDNLILVSASKGSLETALALGRYLDEEALKKVKAWISIGGIHRGTYLADHALTFPKSIIAKIISWIEGFDYSQIKDMSVAKNEPLFNSLNLPKHIYYLQFIGVPLSGQVSDEIESRYYELSKYGPNDGLTTIEHELIKNSHAVIEPGLDHYYRDPQIDQKTLALLVTVLNELNYN